MSLAGTITQQINELNQDSIFLSKKFLSLGKRDNIDKILSRLVKNGLINRIQNGVYHKPIVHQKLGVIPPNLDNFLQIISLKTGEKIYPSGAICANILHLSTQVPAKNIFLTTGKTRHIKNAGIDVYLKHTNIMPFNDTPQKIMVIIFALINIGKTYKHIDDNILNICKKYLNKDDKKYILNMILRVPYWLSQYLYQLISE